MTDPRDEIVQYRIERARETLEEARIMYENGHFNTCANRVYYACFYAVIAMLLADGLQAKTHSEVRSLLSTQYVKEGHVPEHLADFYNKLFRKRQEGDYDDLVRLDSETVAPWIAEGENFVQAIVDLIERQRAGRSRGRLEQPIVTYSS